MERRCMLVILAFGICFAAQAQSPSTRQVLDFPRFRLIGGLPDDFGASPPAGAKLCLLQPKDDCYQMPPHSADGDSKVIYQFGMNPVSEREPVVGGGSLIFFLATFSGGGSGTLERAAVLRYERDGKIVNMLPYVAVTNQSQRQMWSLPEISRYPVLVTADFRWNFAAKETHFARHLYDVTAYWYNPAKDSYEQAFTYVTKKKYPGLDETDRIRVLGPERDDIVRRLRGSRPHR